MPWHFTANVKCPCCVSLWAVTCTFSECLKLFKYSFWMLQVWRINEHLFLLHSGSIAKVSSRKPSDLLQMPFQHLQSKWLNPHLAFCTHKHKTSSAAFYELASSVWYHHVLLRHQLLFYEKYASFPWRWDSERFVLETLSFLVLLIWYNFLDKVI